jgi:methyltransferase-like protein
MTIIGHPWIASIKFSRVRSKDAIEHTASGSILLFEKLDKDIDLILYCQKENLPFAIKVTTIEEAIFAHNLNTRYIFVEKNMAKEIQEIAQHYLFDTQIVVEIESQDEITTYAKLGLDGVVFPAAIEQSYCR